MGRSAVKRALTLILKALFWLALIAIVALTAALVGVAAFGQPAPDPRPSPVAESLRSAANYVEGSDKELRRLNGALAEEQARGTALQAEVERLRDRAWQTWTPETVMQAGGTYRLPDDAPINVVVNASHVTLIGGKGVFAKGSRPAIVIRGDDCEVRGVDFGTTINPDRTGRIGVQECIAVGAEAGTPSYPRGTRIVNCMLGRGDSFVKLFPDANGVTIIGCRTSADSRAESVYVGGAKNVELVDCDFTSRFENTARFNKHGEAVPQNVLVRRCRIANTGSKAAIEFRHVAGAVALDNVLTAGAEWSCIGVGDKDAQPGEAIAYDVLLKNNTLNVGRIACHEGSDRIVIDGNTFVWPAKPVNQAIGFNATAGVTKDVRVTNNAGASPVAQKPMLGFHQGVRPAKLVDEGNAWAVNPPTTQPAN